MYNIPSHWQNIGSWNLSSYKTGTYPNSFVNIMVADVHATQGVKASTAMIFTILIQNNSVYARFWLKSSIVSHKKYIDRYVVTTLHEVPL